MNGSQFNGENIINDEIVKNVYKHKNQWISESINEFMYGNIQCKTLMTVQISSLSEIQLWKLSQHSVDNQIEIFGVIIDRTITSLHFTSHHITSYHNSMTIPLGNLFA